ncbi:MAG: Na+/H+ antiporter NhaA [Actinomycetota bacterium]|nr:Na+/H+ antiporter NhaA [Actinomycetota bacterium]
MLSPLRDFLVTESAGALLIAVGAAAALVWANSPWAASYESFWSSRFSITAAGHTLDLDVRHWLNDGLMTVFFLVVGLEIKREMTDGHLATRRSAALPMVAAVGGMVVPALIYLAIAGGTASRGWAIPMATDIALAVGVLAVAGSRLPTSLRAFLLGLAIVDDIGAIVVIAAVYSTGLSWAWLGAAAVLLLVVVAVRWAGVHALVVYIGLGSLVWLAMHEAGVHPTLAGVALGLLAPSVPRLSAEYIDADDLADVSTAAAAHTTSELAKGSVSVVEWLQHMLHPWTSYLIVPVFALANAGIEISNDGLRDAIGSPIAWGVFAGLLLGKPLGVVGAVLLSVRTGAVDAPQGTRRVQLLGIGTAAGIGFTVAIFITELALPDPEQQASAKLAILAASVVAAAASAIMLRLGPSTGALDQAEG